MIVKPIERFDDEGRHEVRARLAAMQTRILDEALPRASVLVPLCTRRDAPAVLFTKRTETVGTHKGQVSFPGGRMDPEDTDEVATALRELEEELGIGRAAVEVLGRFHDVMSITRMRVTPVIAWIGERGDLSSLQPSAAEIDDVFALTLEEAGGPPRGARAAHRPSGALVHRRTAPGVGPDRLHPRHEVLRDVLGLPIPACPGERRRGDPGQRQAPAVQARPVAQGFVPEHAWPDATGRRSRRRSPPA